MLKRAKGSCCGRNGGGEETETVEIFRDLNEEDRETVATV